MDQILGLKCTICGAEYGVAEVEYVCPKHGDDGILDVIYDYPRIAQRISPSTLEDNPARSIWRYLPLLPVDPTAALRLARNTVLGSVGWTPLYPAPRLAAKLGLRHLWVKDDGRQPTGSFKDRASAIAVAKTRKLGYDVVTTASTGNAAAALSGLCAAVAQPNVIFVPRTAPQAKIAQLLVYGATVLLVDGTYDDAFELCLKAAPDFGWYNRNTAYNPYMSEGKKTVAYEICEQLGNWQAPDVVVVPVGDGCIIGGVHKGFKDLLALGWIEQMPRILDRIKALRAVRETGGTFIPVGDKEIVAAIPTLAQGCGVFAEPAAAAAYAGLVKAVDQALVGKDERVVVLATGSGLKDISTAMKSVGEPTVIRPDLDDVRRAIKQMGN
jgi:threonine synthase